MERIRNLGVDVHIDTIYGDIEKHALCKLGKIDHGAILEIYLDQVFKATKEEILKEWHRRKEENYIEIRIPLWRNEDEL